MEDRLTLEQIKKFPMTTYGRMLGKQLATQVMNELVAYKHIEEELGIDLITLFKALNEGFYHKGMEEQFIPDDNITIQLDISHNKRLAIIIDGIIECDAWLSNYGKIWALTKEELE